MQLDPMETLERAISAGIMMGRRRPAPGAIVESMGSDAREALSRLTSHETQTMCVNPEMLPRGRGQSCG